MTGGTGREIFRVKGNAVWLMQGCRCSFSHTLKICGKKEY